MWITYASVLHTTEPTNYTGSYTTDYEVLLLVYWEE